MDQRISENDIVATLKHLSKQHHLVRLAFTQYWGHSAQAITQFTAPIASSSPLGSHMPNDEPTLLNLLLAKYGILVA